MTLISSLVVLLSISLCTNALPQLRAVDAPRSLEIRAENRAIHEWTAMGDSYASGVGAGPQPADDTNRCFRFPHAYPPIMQSGDGSIQPNPEKFNNVACSGNTFQQILQKEFVRPIFPLILSFPLCPPLFSLHPSCSSSLCDVSRNPCPPQIIQTDMVAA